MDGIEWIYISRDFEVNKFRPFNEFERFKCLIHFINCHVIRKIHHCLKYAHFVLLGIPTFNYN